MTDQRVSAGRPIKASAHALFEIVSSPDGHGRIDGSGMLEAAPDAMPIKAVGDVFDVDMDRTPLNDIPGLVKYKVRNTVTQIVPNQLVEWTIGGVDQPPLGRGLEVSIGVVAGVLNGHSRPEPGVPGQRSGCNVSALSTAAELGPRRSLD